MFPILLNLYEKCKKAEEIAAQQASKEVSKSSNLCVIAERQAMLHFGKANEQAKNIQNKLGLTNIVLLEQVHGVGGCVITAENRGMQEYSVQGDFLVTNQKNVGLGIRTADCLPIVFVDEKHGAVGIAHAGWRGSVGNIIKEVLDCMNTNYGTTAADVSVTFGPGIQKCCYQVGEELVSHLDKQKFSFVSETVTQSGDKYIFDLLLFNEKLARSLGVPTVHWDFSICTFCDDQYHSYRREGDSAGRQISCVWIPLL
jgi:polyphenol oxidase